MRAQDILKVLTQRPFRPFRFYVLETTSYEIRHPEVMMVGRSTITFDVPDPKSILPLAKSSATVALLHITRLEPLFPESKPSSNGD